MYNSTCILCSYFVVAFTVFRFSFSNCVSCAWYDWYSLLYSRKLRIKFDIIYFLHIVEDTFTLLFLHRTWAQVEEKKGGWLCCFERRIGGRRWWLLIFIENPNLYEIVRAFCIFVIKIYIPLLTCWLIQITYNWRLFRGFVPAFFLKKDIFHQLCTRNIIC